MIEFIRSKNRGAGYICLLSNLYKDGIAFNIKFDSSDSNMEVSPVVEADSNILK